MKTLRITCFLLVVALFRLSPRCKGALNDAGAALQETSEDTSEIDNTLEQTTTNDVLTVESEDPRAPECSNYTLLNESNRAMTYNLSRPLICDSGLSGWYRLGGQAGNQMPESCVDKLRCGTHAPGWLNGSHPSVGEGAVRRKVCFHWGNRCCHWSSFIRVRNCGRFFVYELHRPPACTLRYCGNGVPSSPECSNYTILDEFDRAQGYRGGGKCDNLLTKGWYRFQGRAGKKMPEQCVATHRCGTAAPGYLNGRHPTVAEGIVNRRVCFHWSSNCCRWSRSIRVRNCNGFYVYELDSAPVCSLRYCGDAGIAPTTSMPTPTPTPTSNSECSNYRFLNEADRAMTYNQSRPLICDRGLSGWYRFGGQAGNQMPESCVDKLRCGTHAPGWLNGSHPSVGEGAVRRKVCFHWGNRCCHWSSFIRVRNCGRFFVYELHRPPACTLRYCGNGVPSSPAPTTARPTPTPTPTSNSECFSYRYLKEPDRAMTYNESRPLICDSGLSGWYRFGGQAGNQMPESCVDKLRCGTHAPGWLNGSHPSVGEGTVRRKVCFHWSNRCCRWSTYISVRNCGGFFIYKLHRPPACTLRYCGNGLGSTPTPPTAPPSTRANHGFFIFCLPNAMLVNIPRNRLPLQADPGFLHLNDPGCGVLRYDEKTVMLRTPLEGCGTVRRLIGAKVSYYNNVVMPSTNKRSLLQFPFKCAYNRFGLPGKGNTPKPVANHDEVIDSDTSEGTL